MLVLNGILKISGDFFYVIKRAYQKKLIKNNNSRGIPMPEKCFYCTSDIEEKQLHYVSFVSSNKERDESLCDECYKEWLHGLKG
jgi:hypothetical protein